ncbi:MAG: hypothetical protein IAC42_04985 [Spirochaetes bacterium]|uniref:Outer membrane protein beta-barrel domain-containing protein n=1 Tax=Candidatus Aphodenecus pullistercoris TaxID=2840669 RepID=A0A9D9E7Y9_9SPIR|nr:hypothetical protein [Candidatus Aphodenecus pullistercoris]
MKKSILICLILSVALCGAYASFDGYSSLGVGYSWSDGLSLGGFSSQNFGYVDSSPIGYLVSVNADFNIAQEAMTIRMLVGPSWRYMLTNVPMSIDVALGAALAGSFISSPAFTLGLGGYIGATYYLNPSLALLIGCELGGDLMSVDLRTGEVGWAGTFFATPSLALGIRY